MRFKLIYYALAAILCLTSCQEEMYSSHRSEAQDHLRDLSWLIGSWVNKDENITYSSTFTWDKNKNFLVQSFNMEALDTKQLHGQQIIGWDPIRRKVHSWTFDSDGGFGESEWIEQNGDWYATMVFTLPDGRQASATHVYSKVDNDTYTFSSEGRDLDGKILPNIGPFTSIRKRR